MPGRRTSEDARPPASLPILPKDTANVEKGIFYYE